jgi:hypothetical protein
MSDAGSDREASTESVPAQRAICAGCASLCELLSGKLDSLTLFLVPLILSAQNLPKPA